ncbi:succinate dehydrogenase cytochrome b subunit [Reichenbachiella versicolor]|uniref:succinate dehydrogenase cytochrome b subunit n=1 Tax=Reichenbachiella versicolor TaxID=1821036 RepID=UPI000D6E64D1|nr:succinate dehydrogenase cytochrome b subunit [Reichenbachiella versicolor]
MSWITQTLSSSIGKKVLMALTGLFLILFLVVHLAGNLQLLVDDGGQSFNAYAYKMAHNPFIKVVSYGNFFFILLHAVIGIVLTIKNKAARKVGYHVSTKDSESTWASKNMPLLGVIILVFIVVHLMGFWAKAKLGIGEIGFVIIDGVEMHDLYTVVKTAYENILISGFYVISMIALGFHLSHGFQSAFQSLGLNHKKYTPLFKTVGTLYSYIVCFGFAIIPILMYLGISF